VLNRVLDLVARHSWFDVSTPFEKTINLTQGSCLWLMLTRSGVCDTYVKFSDCVSLGQEAQRYAAANRWYPTLVPRFVGHVEQDGLSVMVCSAVDYRSLNASRLHQPEVRARVFRDLNQYFAAMRKTQLAQALTPVRNAELVESLGAYFDAHALAPLARRWLGSDAARRATVLPDMPQHGDLVLNNIGQARDGAVVVFDWEDFGACCLPGLDLFTLELSLAGDAAQLISGRERTADPRQHFVRDACLALQLDFDDYSAMTPVYALVFRHLKRNYGPGVRDWMDRLLLDLNQQRTMSRTR
jgi:hypothetical protein